MGDHTAQLINIVKAGQRSNQDVKNRWAEYCLTKCDGTKDPAKHSAESLEGFLTSIAHEYENESWFQNPSSVPSRATVGGGAGGGGGGGTDPEKRRYVALIKAGQRQSGEWKNEWGLFANENLNSVKDPNAHNAPVLAEFVALMQPKFGHEPWFKAPEEFAPPPRERAPTRPTTFTAVSSSGVWNGNEAWMHADPSMPAHPELVHMIKERQRADPSFKEAWGQFCDSYCEGIRDPCRHPGANVIQFLEMQGHLPKGGFAQRFGNGQMAAGPTGGQSGRSHKSGGGSSRNRFNPY